MISRNNIFNPYKVPKIKNFSISIDINKLKKKNILFSFWVLFILTGIKPSLKKSLSKVGQIKLNLLQVNCNIKQLDILKKFYVFLFPEEGLKSKGSVTHMYWSYSFSYVEIRQLYLYSWSSLDFLEPKNIKLSFHFNGDDSELNKSLINIFKLV